MLALAAPSLPRAVRGTDDAQRSRAMRLGHPSCALLLVAGALLGGCGSRSGLLDRAGSSAATGGAPAIGGSSGAGWDASTGFGGSSGFDAGPDAPPPPPPPPPPDCIYQQHGEPIVVFTYSEGVYTPELARLSPGDASSPARLAVSLIHDHFWHPDIRVAELAISEPWPDGVSIPHAMVGYGIDAHAPGRLTIAAGGQQGLALFYFHADEASSTVIPGVKFRRFDTSSWQALDEVFVEQLASYAYSISQGALPDPMGGWTGDGYGVTWRSPTNGSESLVAPRAAVLDLSGAIVAGPFAVAPESVYPGIGATIAWTGQGYLVAHNQRPCDDDSPSCANQFTLSRLEPSAGLIETAEIAPLPGMRARTPLVRSHAGAGWATWREQSLDAQPGDDVPSTLRLVKSDPNGLIAGGVWQTDAHPDAGSELLASDQGVLLIWGERLDPTLDPHSVGHSRLRLRQFSKAGQELQEIVLLTTSLTSGTAYSVATIDQPRALIVAYTAEDQNPANHAVAYLARFDCLPH